MFVSKEYHIILYQHQHKTPLPKPNITANNSLLIVSYGDSLTYRHVEGRQFKKTIILMAVRWYLAYAFYW